MLKKLLQSLFIVLIFTTSFSVRSDEFNQVVLYSESELIIERDNTISGDVGSRELLLFEDTNQIAGHIFSFNMLEVRGNGNSAENAYSQEYLDFPSSALSLSGSWFQIDEYDWEFEFPEFEVNFSDQEPEVQPDDEGVFELNEGEYGHLEINHDVTLVFTGGEYHFKRIHFLSDVQVEFDGPTTLYIQDSFEFDADVIMTYDDSVMTADDVTWYSNGTYDHIFGDRSQVIGTFFLPYGPALLAPEVNLEGSLFAKFVYVQNDITITGVAPCLPEAEICDDGIDQSCSGSDLDCRDADQDGDGYTINDGDCDDFSTEIYPGIIVDLGYERCDEEGNLLPLSAEDAASSLSETTFTNFQDSYSFIYSGSDATQTGVDEAELVEEHVSLVRGQVYNDSGAGLAGVTITVLGHDEYGQTLTRSDGSFDLVANGGTTLVLNYVKTGYLPMQRKVSVGWNQVSQSDDIVMVELDSNVATIDLTGGSATMQSATGTTQTDTDGSRTGMALIPSGVTATLTLEDGTTSALTSGDLRITEYTVGTNGRERMPATLPANSAYTYAVEISFDEALAQNATTVNLSSPLIYYVDNFIGFPVGGAVPVGYYDRELAAWVPSNNGLIVENLGDLDGDGLIELDLTGDGVAATTTELSNLGVTTEERQNVASQYSTGATLWRVPIPHLTPWDCNWPYAPPSSTPSVDALALSSSSLYTNSPCKDNSCEVDLDNQALNKRANLTGTPLQLHYNSQRVPGRRSANQLDFDLTASSLSSLLKRVEVDVEVAGQIQTQIFSSPTAAATYAYEWDGLDGFGRNVNGMQTATAEVRYVYTPEYKEPGLEFDQSFGEYGSGVSLTGSRDLNEVTFTKQFQRVLGQYQNPSTGLMGWSYSIHHAYDINTSTLILGDGTVREARNYQKMIDITAGTGDFSTYSGDGGLAIDATTPGTDNIAVDSQGRIYYAYSGHLVRMIDTDGIIQVVAGTGSRGYSGDGGQATSARLGIPKGVAVDRLDNLYINDGGNFVIRKVDASGVITTVAGNGTQGDSGDGGLATDASFSNIDDVYIDAEGNIYLSDYTAHKVRKVNPSGIIQTIAGNGSRGYSGDSGQATDAELNYPRGLVVDSNGNLFIADWANCVVRKVDTAGRIETYAGSGICGYAGDGGDATNSELDHPNGLAIDSLDNLYIADSNNDVVRKVNSEGVITTVVGTGQSGDTAESTPALQALVTPYDLDVDGDNNLHIAHLGTASRRLYKMSSYFTNESSTGDIVITSSDGSQVFIFDETGLHQETRHALTGEVIYSFAYNSEGLLESVTDGDGLQTTLEHEGSLIRVTSPFGQVSRININGEGYVELVENPNSESLYYSYIDGGLMETAIDSNGHTKSYSYDSDTGHLIDSSNALQSQALSFSEVADDERVVSLSQSLGNASTYSTQFGEGSDLYREITDAAGFVTMYDVNESGVRTLTLPSGQVVEQTMVVDPRFGLDASYPSSVVTTTPSGLEQTISTAKSSTLSDPNDLLSLSSQTTTVSLNGKVSTSVYDQSANTITNTSAEGREVEVTLDSQGRVVNQSIDGVDDVSYTYNSQGLLEYIDQGVSTTRRVEYIYNSEGYVEAVIDPLSQVTQYEYDQIGQVTRITYPDGRETQITYDDNGNIESLTPASKPVHTFAYNELNFETGYLPPDIGLTAHNTTYTYDANGRLDVITRPDSKTIDYDYDSGNRIDTITTATGVYTYNYDSATGQLESIEAPSSEDLSYTYDGELLTSEIYAGSFSASVDFEYNSDFNIQSILVNGADSIDYTYDDDLLLETAGDMTFVFSATNTQLQSTSLNNINTAYTYTNFGEVDTVDATLSSSSVFSKSYTYDDLGRILTISESILNTSGSLDSNTYAYTYNNANRLESATLNGTTTTYNYDDNGNRSGDTVDDQDRLIVTSAGVSFTYNNNGDVETKTDSSGTTTYVYDEFGNLTSVTLPSGTVITYLIDGNNRRIGYETNGVFTKGYVYQDQLNIIAELDSTGNVESRFVYGTKSNVPEYMVKSGSTYQILTDHNGSVRLVLESSTGTIAQRIDYDEYGQITNDTNPGFQPFGYAGGLYDVNTNLTRFGARDYNPQTGRWMTKDPIRFEGGDTNLYGYVLNDPVNFVDVTGLATTGKRNIGTEGFTRHSDPKKVKQALKDAIRKGQKKRIRSLRGLLKVIKRGGTMSFPLIEEFAREVAREGCKNGNVYMCNVFKNLGGVLYDCNSI